MCHLGNLLIICDLFKIGTKIPELEVPLSVQKSRVLSGWTLIEGCNGLGSMKNLGKGTHKTDSVPVGIHGSALVY